MNGFLIGNPFILLTKNLKYKKIIFDNTSIIYKEVLIHMLLRGKKLNVNQENGNISVEFENYVANVTINGQDKMVVSYSDHLDLDEVTKKLTKAILKESSKSSSVYNEVFPAFGKEFKMLVSNILKARV